MSTKIAVIGLGYVGLPLALLFATKYQVVGFDINKTRITELNSGIDKTLEVSDEDLQAVLVQDFNTDTIGLNFSDLLTDIADCNYYIVTVPTPVDKNNRPDLTPLYKASETVGKVLKKGISSFMNLRYIQVPQKKNVFQYWRKYLDYNLILIFLQDIHPSELILEIKNIL